ncbi:presenilin family intramembrane aspartyl protease PSH [Halolamina salifodinae]|uniref:Presenilin-like A22 family membrane protease n=1 Tax=Halolamina salifodinae TaxID=1202767 RepID=A0A8T4GY63_9EURY|nr:presenilin family intramembrane aspartyl protease PSH [Halolamina salifodinae]MBP1987063.1 presenilin-like A22 family membrane protease [Halolamina salifodinae]
MTSRAFRGTAFAALLFLLVQLGALALIPAFQANGYQQFENPQDPTNSLVYVGLILVMTVLMLAAFKYGYDWVVRAFVVFTSGLLAWYVLGVFLPGVVAIPASALVAVALWVYPEWYVIDAAGVVMGAGAAGLFGISFGLLPAILLLAVLAVYDAISVYGTEHMLDLAEGVMDLRIPVVLVIPLTLGYSILPDDEEEDGEAEESDDESADETDSHDEEASTPADEAAVEGEGEAIDERDAFFIGLGDAVMPTVLVASAAQFLDAGSLGFAPIPALNVPALTAMVGTFVGLLILLRMVFAGRAHAGLPLLNGGAIGGYLIGALAVGVPLTTALGL